MAAPASLEAVVGPDARDRFPQVKGAGPVVAPTSPEEVAAVLRAASEHGLRVLVWGGGTHQGLGHHLDPDVVLVTADLNRLVDWQPEDLTVVVEGGMTVAQLESTLAGQGQTAVLPEAPGAGTVGGAVASGASAMRRLRYGPTRDRVLEVTIATGDGRLVTAGGRVVKNVTGYDIPRLATGSLGALGVIVSICLKLWPLPAHTATIPVDDPVAAFRIAYRPLAVMETAAGSAVYVAGTAEEVAAQAADLGGEAAPGLAWPVPPSRGHVLVLRVPPASTAAAVERVRALGSDVAFKAAHGVGEVVLGVDSPDFAALRDLRGWAESLGGALVTAVAPAETREVFDPWGTPPPTVDLQRRVKAAFDPAGVVNPGRLPGRI